MQTVDEGGDGRQIDLPLGELLEIRLAENPTTGFRWHLVANGSPACVLAGDSYEAAGRRPGQGGQHVWRFRAARRGEVAIELRYARAWQPEAPAGRRFGLRLRISS
jgi:inhibitor of cysteine peptidase